MTIADSLNKIEDKKECQDKDSREEELKKLIEDSLRYAPRFMIHYNEEPYLDSIQTLK